MRSLEDYDLIAERGSFCTLISSKMKEVDGVELKPLSCMDAWSIFQLIGRRFYSIITGKQPITTIRWRNCISFPWEKAKIAIWYVRSLFHYLQYNSLFLDTVMRFINDQFKCMSNILIDIEVNAFTLTCIMTVKQSYICMIFRIPYIRGHMPNSQQVTSIVQMQHN